MASESTTAIILPDKPVGLMDLATEIRLQIYGCIFAGHGKRCCGVPDSHGSHCCLRTRRKEHVRWNVKRAHSTCSPVPTAILCVNKQIFHEALSVMHENVELLVRLPCQVSGAPLCELKRMISVQDVLANSIRRVAVATSLYNAGVQRIHHRSPGTSRLERHCQLIKAHYPSLRELRIHIEHVNLRYDRVRTEMRLEAVSAAVLRHFDGIVLFLDVNSVGVKSQQGQRDFQDLKNRIITNATERAKSVGKNVTFEFWG